MRLWVWPKINLPNQGGKPMGLKSFQLEQLLGTFEDFVAGDTKQTEAKAQKKGSYHYIPLRLDRFVEQVADAIKILAIIAGNERDRAEHIKFIDVGCGIGTKMLVAHDAFGLVPCGIEYNQRYVHRANQLLNTINRHGNKRMFVIIRGDAIKHDYAWYDLIYFYCPLSNEKLQIKLEERIIATAKPGALILTNLKKGDWKSWQEAGKVRHRLNDIYEVLPKAHSGPVNAVP